jgi:hypothetical protein
VRKLAVSLIGAVLLVASTAAAGGAQRTVRAKPSAAVRFLPAVVIVGKHFKARERVTAKLVASTTYVRRVRSNALGSFRIELGAIALNDCNAFTLKVIGTLGSRFSLTHPAKPC